MKHFWQFARRMLHYRKMLALTLIAATLDALCAFGGLQALIIAFRQLIEKDQTLREFAAYRLNDPDLIAWVGNHLYLVDYLPQSKFGGWVLIVSIIFVLALIGSIFRFFYQYGAITVSFRTVMDVRRRAFQRLVHLPLAVTMQQGTADNLSRVVRDCNIIARGLNSLLGKAVREILMGLAALTAALTVDWKLTGIFLIALPVVAVLIRKFGKRIRRASKAAMAQYGKMVGAVQESLQAIRIVKVHQAEGYERRRFNQINRQVWNKQMQARITRAMSTPIIEMMAIAGIIAVTVVAAWYLFDPNTTSDPQNMIIVVGMLGFAGNAFRPLATMNNDLQEASAAAGRIDEVLHLPVEANTRQDARAPGAKLPRHSRSVAFENITFTYPEAARPALKNVSLRVAQGKTCAIVGANGSGKSTLLALLPRLFDPDAGRILIDETDIGACALKSVRRQMAVVTQDTVLFNGTIGENVTYGLQYIGDEKMIAAAKRAHAHEFITALPQGYDTSIGEWGARLSGGQRQRIAIARAILRDPAILILDEATSQIDADSEANITAALADFTVGRTTFVIAHRLSTVIDADLIAVLHDGRLVDQGSHHQLLERCSAYQQIARNQLQPAIR